MSKFDHYTPEGYTRFTMRLNTELFDKIKLVAAQEKRSAAKQIEFILEQWINQNTPKE